MRRAEQREKAARERAEASESRYRFLADMVPQMVWTCNARGELDYVNRRWMEFFDGKGPKSGDRFVSSADGTIHPEDRPRFLEAGRIALEAGTPFEVECRRFSVPAGEYRWLLIRAMPMLDASGQVLRWFGTCTDVENQKQALAERERLLAEARHLAEERESLIAALHAEGDRKNEFLAILSHELRNPLTPVANSLYILERAAPDGEQAKRAREVIERQVRHMTRLIDDLLDVTRITRGKIRLHSEPLELNGLLRRSSEDHRENFRRAGIELDVRLLKEPLVVLGDPTRIAQVVGNVLQNAAKFTRSGGQVILSLQREGTREALIVVEDTGAGMTEETLSRVFEPFVQAEHTIDRSGGGLGLGLALARGIVSLHGGTIDARSEGPGRGSVFTVRLPLDTSQGTLAKPRVADSCRGAAHRILIIEDNVDAAQSLREVLELSAHTVEVARDGSEGLARARTFEPEIVLCDIGLPAMDGYTVARQMRADPRLKAAFLVALSGYALKEDIDRSREAGFDWHMAKPATIEAIGSVLAEARLRQPKLDGVC
jgi:PAS domain S-box-containing protein